VTRRRALLVLAGLLGIVLPVGAVRRCALARIAPELRAPRLFVSFGSR
jgi:hypothetical protein